MNTQKKFLVKFLAFVLLLILVFKFCNHDSNNFKLQTSEEKKIDVDYLIKTSYRLFKSECDCKKHNVVAIKKVQNDELLVYIIKNKKLVKSYKLTRKEFEESEYTCNHYSIFKHGRNQKIIGYALYGKGRLFYYNFVNLVKTAKKILPDWNLRVYYDDSIDHDIKCKIECIKDENSNDLIDNVDFCNINQLPVKNSFDEKWSGSYMHAMIWRWLPIGDNFVDVFSSRDLDSHLIQREVDAVNDWFSSNKTAHIMRDHPDHGTLILGGMWGFYNARDRKLANEIYKSMLDKGIASQYNNNNQKGNDQFFLSAHVYNKIKSNSKIHDSFLCNMYHDSVPYPSRRQGALFVSFGSELNELYEYTYNKTFHRECPMECRPEHHKDWKFC